MPRDDLAHEHGDLVRCVKLAGFLAGVSGDVADEVLVDEAEHVVVLPAVHRDILDEVDEVASGLGPAWIISSQLGEARLQRVEDAVEDTLACRVYIAAKGGKRVAHVRYLEVAALCHPSGEEVVVSDKVAALALDELDRLLVVFHQAGQVLLGEVSRLQAGNLGLGQELVEDESQNVILVLVSLNLGSHLVGRLPYLGGQLLFIHLVFLASIDLVERFPVVAYPFDPAVLAAAEHEHRRGAGCRELEILGEFCDSARIAEDLPARGCDARVLQHGPREVYFRAGEHDEVPGSFVVAPRSAYAVLLRVEDHWRACGTLVDPVEVVPQGHHPEENPLVQALDSLFLVRIDVGLRRRRVVGLVRTMGAHVVDGLRLEDIQCILADVLVVIEEHDGLVPELLLCLVCVEPGDTLGCLASVDTTHVAVILVEQVVDATLRDIRQRLRFSEVLPRNDDSDKRLSVDAADADAVWLRVYELDGESLD